MWWNSVVGLGLEQAARATLGVTSLRYRSIGTAEAIEHPGDGPVVLLGGLCETRPCLEPMALWLTRLGYDASMPDGAFYLWVPAPDGDAWASARDLAERAGMIVSPGEFYGRAGASYFRVAAVQPDERIELVAGRVGLPTA